jgi:hypothetical protein
MFLLVLQEIKSHKTFDYLPSKDESSRSYWCKSQRSSGLRYVLSRCDYATNISEKPVVPSNQNMQNSAWLDSAAREERFMAWEITIGSQTALLMLN